MLVRIESLLIKRKIYRIKVNEMVDIFHVFNNLYVIINVKPDILSK